MKFKTACLTNVEVVHEHSDGTFWFLNETYTEEYGPFATKQLAEEAHTEYVKTL